MTEPIEAFLRVRVSFGVSASGQPVIASTRAEGAWLRVFTSRQGLADHHAATNDPSTGTSTISGAEVACQPRLP